MRIRYQYKSVKIRINQRFAKQIMTKKIYDILPPRLVSSTKEKPKYSIDSKKPKHKTKRERKNYFPLHGKVGGILVSLGVFVIILAVFLYFKLASVSVVIWPKTEDINFTEEITAEKSLTIVDLENKKIPAQIIEEEKELWQEFEATGSVSKDGKAEGIIKVYNKLSPAKAISLVTNTRFLSDSGKYFRSVKKITIPAAQVKSGKVVPGSIDVKVLAIEAGEGYNIGAATFSVPGLAGTSMYYSIYAELSSKMEGGFKSTVKIVTAEDIEIAEDILTKKLLNETTEIIKNKALSSGLTLFDNALSKKTTEASSSVKAGTEVDEFTYRAKAKVSGLVFKDADLNDFIKNYILSQIASDRTFLESSLTTNYIPITIDLNNRKMTFNLEISGKIYPKINEEELFSKFSGKSSSEIQEIVYTAFFQEVSQIKINMWPFWVKKAPKNQNKIKTSLNFE
ncbi:hypothetical protein KJ786_01910 [Patescibacteria group bacterium]|nr:hypothetical protein [Patescibacteria group bacterium]